MGNSSARNKIKDNCFISHLLRNKMPSRKKIYIKKKYEEDLIWDCNLVLT